MVWYQCSYGHISPTGNTSREFYCKSCGRFFLKQSGRKFYKSKAQLSNNSIKFRNLLKWKNLRLRPKGRYVEKRKRLVKYPLATLDQVKGLDLIFDEELISNTDLEMHCMKNTPTLNAHTPALGPPIYGALDQSPAPKI